MHTTMLITMLGLAMAGTPARAAIVTFSDESAFLQTASEIGIEGFESHTVGEGVTALDFGPEITSAAVSTSGTGHDSVHSQTDGHGAVVYEGDRFWKLRGGSVTLSFDHRVTGFGFYFSDLEGADLAIVLDQDPGRAVSLAPAAPNPNTNAFFAISDGARFQSVTISWNNNHGDGVGLDRVMVSRGEVPTPGSTALLASALALGVIRRHRETASSQQN